VVTSAIRELALVATLFPIYVGCRSGARILASVESVMLR
jgi:hypothetical protein